MKPIRNPMLKRGLILGITGASAALLLALVNFFTEPAIAALREQKLSDTLALLAPEGITGEVSISPAPGILRVWPSGENRIVETEASGYGGPMVVLAVFNRSGTILAARLMDNSETVGFGKKAEDPSYMEIFAGTGGPAPVPSGKSEVDADIVSGATITFSGISEALTLASEFVKSGGVR